jgi:hypothetical protein
MSNYSSVDEVAPYCRMFLEGSISFGSESNPTRDEVDTVLDRLCGVLDLALQREGIAVPITNSTAKYACDDWVTRYAVMEVKRMAPGYGFNDENQNTMTSYKGLMDSAMQFAKDNRLGFIDLGVTQTRNLSDGLAFTGQDAQSDRSDPDDTSLEQPMFTRGQWNDSTVSTDFDDETD